LKNIIAVVFVFRFNFWLNCLMTTTTGTGRGISARVPLPVRGITMNTETSILITRTAITNSAGYVIARGVANVGPVDLAIELGLPVTVSLQAETLDGMPPGMAAGDYTGDVAGVCVSFRIGTGGEFGSPVLHYVIVIDIVGAVRIGGAYMSAGQIVDLDEDARATRQKVPAVAREYIRAMATLI